MMALQNDQEVIEMPRLKEESMISDPVYNEEGAFSDPSLTSPTMSTSEEDYPCYDPLEHTPPPLSTTGQKRGRPIKDFNKWRPVKKTFAKKEWTDEEVSLLIDLWRNEEILYNTKNELHSNKEERSKSLDRITYELNQNQISVCVEQVSEKMTSLRCYYSGQIGKERASKTNGAEIFISPWKFMKNLSFLESNYKPRNSDFRHMNIYGSSGSNTMSIPSRSHTVAISVPYSVNAPNSANVPYSANAFLQNGRNSSSSNNNVHEGIIVNNDLTNNNNGVASSDAGISTYITYTPRSNNNGSFHGLHGENNNIIISAHNSANITHNNNNNTVFVSDNQKSPVAFHCTPTSVHTPVNIHEVSSETRPVPASISGIASHGVNNSVQNVTPTSHNGTTNTHSSHIPLVRRNSSSSGQKDKTVTSAPHEFDCMSNTLKHIVDMTLQRLSRDGDKTSDETFGELVVSLLKEVENPEKKDLVKLEIHNLLVKAKYNA